jgi:hypothetical protein
MANEKKGAQEAPGEAKNRQIRILLSPLQDAQVKDIRLQTGRGEAETIRRAIDFYMEYQQSNGLYIPSPAATPAWIAEKRLAAADNQ